jgi:hypothetical protein
VANAWSAAAFSGLDRNSRLRGCCCHTAIIRPVGLVGKSRALTALAKAWCSQVRR